MIINCIFCNEEIDVDFWCDVHFTGTDGYFDDVNAIYVCSECGCTGKVTCTISYEVESEDHEIVTCPDGKHIWVPHKQGYEVCRTCGEMIFTGQLTIPYQDLPNNKKRR